MPKEITIKLVFDETWDSYAEENIADDFYVIDAIRDLAPGVVWQIQPQQTSNFITDCIAGKSSILNISHYVEEWHNSGSKLPLYKYLGMSDDEYMRFFRNESSLEDIINTHKNNT